MIFKTGLFPVQFKKQSLVKNTGIVPSQYVVYARQLFALPDHAFSYRF